MQKDPAKLNLAESLFLAVIPESPYARNPAKSSAQLLLAAQSLAKQSFNDSQSLANEIKTIKLSGRVLDLPKEAMHYTNRLANENPFQNKIIILKII